MKYGDLRVAVCTALLCTGTAMGQTAEEKCQERLAKEWGKFQKCVENVIGNVYGGDTYGYYFKAFWACRHTYFRKWTGFQSKSSLQGSSCIGSRFTDNGDGTVSDKLTGLVWEKKTDDGSVHDKDNLYTWSTGSPWAESGTAFTGFLSTLNSSGFAGSSGWRIPTLAELESITSDFPCSGTPGGSTCQCLAAPCIAFADPNTGLATYPTSTTEATNPSTVWQIFTADGDVYTSSKSSTRIYRAVRGGL